MQKGRVWDRRLPRACCGEGDQGIYLISPPCPYALIAPQQTSFVGKLPAVDVQGYSAQEPLCGGCGWGSKISGCSFSGLTLPTAQRGDLLNAGAVLVLPKTLFFLGHGVLLCYLLSFKALVFLSESSLSVAEDKQGKLLHQTYVSLCLYLSSKNQTDGPKKAVPDPTSRSG